MAPVPTTFDFFPTAVSGDGAVVVGRGFDDQLLAMRWSAAEGARALGAFTPRAVSADGAVIAGEAELPSGARQAVRLAGATLAAIPFPRTKDSNSQVIALTTDGGTLAGNAWTDVPIYTSVQAFRWTAAGGTQPLDVLSGDDANQVLAMSPDGSAIAGVSLNLAQRRARPFLWTSASGTVELPALPGSSLTLPVAVNDTRVVAGEAFVGGDVEFASVSGATSRQPIVWTQGPPRVIGECGALPSTAAAVASDPASTILGACGQDHLFLTSPPGQTRVLMLPPIPAGYTAAQQAVRAVGLAGDGAIVVGQRALESLGGTSVNVLVWTSPASLPAVFPLQWTTTAGAQVSNPTVTALSAGGSTMVGIASDHVGWIVRVR